MQFYRRLSPIKAISFDLDDTLYNNRPVMLAIEQKMIAYFTAKFAQLFAEHHINITLPNAAVFNSQFWAPYRQQAIKANDDISHDVVQLRFESYRLGFIAHHIPAQIAALQAQAGLDYFISLRSDFIVPQASMDLLESLSQKYPLVAISNGNVDTQKIGIAHYFQHIYHAGYQPINAGSYQSDNNSSEYLLRMKPSTDMFAVVCNQLSILPEQLLHVGDCGNADIHGALNAGCQTAWLPQYGVGKSLRQVPHIALKNITDLASLW